MTTRNPTVAEIEAALIDRQYSANWLDDILDSCPSLAPIGNATDNVVPIRPGERAMNEPKKDPSDMTDRELAREWSCVEECDYSASRTEALAAEIERRNIDI